MDSFFQGNNDKGKRGKMVEDIAVQQDSAIYKSLKNKKWSKAETDQNLINAIRNKSGVPYIVAEILSQRNIVPADVESFLNPKLKNLLPDPSVLQDMGKAVDVTIKAIQEEKKITIFGDYDVDGATSSALIKRILKAVGHENVDVYIPDRTSEGYGMNVNAIGAIKKTKTDLIITVDCGATSHEPIEAANALGIQVVVIDHHLCDEELPKAEAIVNPSRLDDSSGLEYLAAVGVAFLFVVALARKLVSLNIVRADGIPDLISLLDLVALGTVCDVVPLVGLNRAIVRSGLKVIESRRNAGIKALLETSRTAAGVTDITTYHLGFVLGPRINASGRVGQSYFGSELLSLDDYKECLDIAMKLEMYNHERKILENKVLEEALSKATFVSKETPVMCIDGKDWHHGVVGIVAERLKERFNKPTAVISLNDEGIGKASCRSINGIDIGDAVIQAKNEGILSAGGGHKMAAGFSISEDKIEELKVFLTEKFKSIYKKIISDTISYYDCVLSIESVTPEMVRLIDQIGPFGNGNEQPKFLLNNVSIVHATLLKGEHVSCVLKDFSNKESNKTVKGICFRAVQSPLGEVLLSKRPNIDLIVTLSLNRWQNRESAEVMIHDAVLKEKS